MSTGRWADPRSRRPQGQCWPSVGQDWVQWLAAGSPRGPWVSASPLLAVLASWVPLVVGRSPQTAMGQGTLGQLASEAVSLPSYPPHLAQGIPGLVPTGWQAGPILALINERISNWCSPAPVPLWWDELSQLATARLHIPRLSFNCLLPLQDILQYQQVGLIHVLFKVLLLLRVSEYVRFLCALYKSDLHFPQPFFSPENMFYWLLKSDILGGSPSCYGTQCGAWISHSLGEALQLQSFSCLQITYLVVWVLTVLCLHLSFPIYLWFCLYIFSCRRSFLLVFRVLLWIVTQQIVATLVYPWEEVRSVSSGFVS